jgi:transcriptional regulator with XRE-family HTH domain
MTTMRIHPQWLPTARALDAAIKASGKDYSQVARAIGVSTNTIYNRVRGRVGVNEAAAKAMAKAIGCAWEPLVSPKDRRPGSGKNKPRVLGPATRALALHETALRPVQPPPAAIAPPRPTPVLGFELYSDGTSHIALKASLPADRGSALLRQLLDFGLVQT